MLRILIDEKGHSKPVGRRIATDEFWQESSIEDDIATAIRVLGFVYIERVQRSLVIVFRPSLVSAASIAATYQAVYGDWPARIVLSHGLSELSHESYDDVEAGLRRMEELAEAARLPSLKTGISAERRSLDRLTEIKSGAMTNLLGAWSETLGIWSPDLFNKLRGQGLLGDTLVVQGRNRSEALTIAHWGSRRQIFGREWASAARGQDIREQPHPRMTDWVIETIEQAHAERQPRLDNVKAVVVSPSGLIRRRDYHRLLLPYLTENGDSYSVVINVGRES